MGLWKIGCARVDGATTQNLLFWAQMRTLVTFPQSAVALPALIRASDARVHCSISYSIYKEAAGGGEHMNKKPPPAALQPLNNRRMKSVRSRRRIRDGKRRLRGRENYGATMRLSAAATPF